MFIADPPVCHGAPRAAALPSTVAARFCGERRAPGKYIAVRLLSCTGEAALSPETAPVAHPEHLVDQLQQADGFAVADEHALHPQAQHGLGPLDGLGQRRGGTELAVGGDQQVGLAPAESSSRARLRSSGRQMSVPP